jgi:hypothetical protein
MKKVIKPAPTPARNRKPAAKQSKSNRARTRPELPELAQLAASARTNSHKPPISCPRLLSSYFPTRAGIGSLHESVGGGPAVADETAGTTTRGG